MKRYEYGNPFDTEAIVEKVDATKGNPKYGTISQKDGFV